MSLLPNDKSNLLFSGTEGYFQRGEGRHWPYLVKYFMSLSTITFFQLTGFDDSD